MHRLIMNNKMAAFMMMAGLASGGLMLPGVAAANLKMLTGEAGRANVVYTGSITYALTNTSSEPRYYTMLVRDKDGDPLEYGGEYRLQEKVIPIAPGATERVEVRFKPGNAERKLLICAQEVTKDGTTDQGIIARVCSRSVVYMGLPE